jgi:hypothetical protein
MDARKPLRAPSSRRAFVLRASSVESIREGSFYKNSKQIVSWSRGTPGWNWRGRTGYCVRTCWSVSRTDDLRCKTAPVMAPGGGYIAAPRHTPMEEVPWDNIAVFHQDMRTYGAYPNPGESRFAVPSIGP